MDEQKNTKIILSKITSFYETNDSVKSNYTSSFKQKKAFTANIPLFPKAKKR